MALYSETQVPSCLLKPFSLPHRVASDATPTYSETQDSTSIRTDSHQTEPIRPNRVVSTGNRNDRNGPKRSKQAKIGLESCQNMSSHDGIGDDDDKVELLELGSVYGSLAPFCCFCFRFCIGILCVCVYKGRRLRCTIDHQLLKINKVRFQSGQRLAPLLT